MAKKAQAAAKAVAKKSAKPTKVAAKKSAKAAASSKPIASKVKAVKSIVPKPDSKASVKAPAKVAPQTPAKKNAPAPAVLEKKPAAPLADVASKKVVSKAAQAAEASEKIKIDKSMTEEQAKWAEMYNKYRDAQASNYDMKATFNAASAIQHKVLGWGWIVSNDNDRLEVLFKDGKRMLISNYRG